MLSFKRRGDKFNPKRKMRSYSVNSNEENKGLSQTIKYGGNSEHKKNPNDFNLVPPVSPRSAKSLCDDVEIFEKKKAAKLLKEGARRGMISKQERNGFPQNIWAVDENGKPLEAQLENQELGTYHGYPVPESDPFGTLILTEWSKRT